MTSPELAQSLSQFDSRYLPRRLRMAAKKATIRSCRSRCVYCGAALTKATTTIDHVLPLARGGTNEPANMVAACHPCNQAKRHLHPDDWFAAKRSRAACFLAFALQADPALRQLAADAVMSPYSDVPDVGLPDSALHPRIPTVLASGYPVKAATRRRRAKRRRHGPQRQTAEALAA